MKLNKIAVIAAIGLGATLAFAQQNSGTGAAWVAAEKAIKAMPERQATMQEAINGAAGEVVTAFGGYIQEKEALKGIRTLTNKSSLAAWLIEEEPTFKPAGRFMDEKALQSAQTAINQPQSVKPWFTPFDAKLKAFSAGNYPAGEDAFLRLYAVANLNAFSLDELKGAGKVSSSVEMAAHFYLTSRHAQFASAFSERIAKDLKTKYKTPDEFKADFVRVVMAIPQDQLKELFLAARANAETNATYQATFSMFDQTERWTTKGKGYEYAYTLNPIDSAHEVKGLTIEKGGKPIYGKGYIGGKFQTVQVDELDKPAAFSMSSK